MGNTSASQVNVRSFKVIDPLDTVYQYLFLLVAKMHDTMDCGVMEKALLRQDVC